MTNEDILRMAREADPFDEDGRLYAIAALTPKTLARFAALVAAAERESCAQACDAISNDRWALYKGRKPYTGREPGRASNFAQGESDGAGACADAIRARGK